MSFTSPSYRAKHRHSTEDGDVYQVGRYEITVRRGEADPSEAVRYVTAPGYAKESGPHLEIVDGQVTIDLHDILDMVLFRSAPEEIAAGLWRHQEVREAFCDAFIGEAYGTGDSDWDGLRRKTIQQANENLLATALNKAADVLRSAEYYERKYWELYHGDAYMRGRVERPDFLPGFHENTSGDMQSYPGFWVEEDPEYKIGSKNWHEARDWWRDRLLAMLASAPAKDVA